MTTIEMTTIHPVERLAHRVGLLLVRWSVARAERRDRVLASRRVGDRWSAAVQEHDELRARDTREQAWLLRSAEVPRVR